MDQQQNRVELSTSGESRGSVKTSVTLVGEPAVVGRGANDTRRASAPVPGMSVR
jgi:hypothetical protein